MEDGITLLEWVVAQLNIRHIYSINSTSYKGSGSVPPAALWFTTPPTFTPYLIRLEVTTFSVVFSHVM